MTPARPAPSSSVKPTPAGAFLLRPKLLFVGRGELLLGREEGKGLGLPIPIGPHKGTGAVERFHIAEPKGSTSVRDRSMSRRLVPAASKSNYALCSGSLIRKIKLGWGSTM